MKREKKSQNCEQEFQLSLTRKVLSYVASWHMEKRSFFIFSVVTSPLVDRQMLSELGSLLWNVVFTPYANVTDVYVTLWYGDGAWKHISGFSLDLAERSNRWEQRQHGCEVSAGCVCAVVFSQVCGHAHRPRVLSWCSAGVGWVWRCWRKPGSSGRVQGLRPM